MKRTLPLLAALVLLATASPADARGKLKVYGGVTPNVIIEGGAAEMKIVVEGPGSETSSLDLPEVDGLAFLDPQKSTSFNAVFTRPGGMQQQVRTEWRVRVVALRAGTYRIPPFTVRSKGRIARTPRLSLRVTPVKGGQDKVLAWLKATPAAEEIYVGEPLRVGLELGLRLPHANNEIPDRRLFSAPTIEPSKGLERMKPGPAPPQRNADNALTVPVAGGKTLVFDEDPNAGGAIYRVFETELAWLPKKPGVYKFGEARYASQMATRVERVRDFFEDRYVAQEVRSALGTSKPFQVRVRPVPIQGRPQDFSGYVGRLEQRVSVDRRRVAVGESLKLTREIVGNGNLELVEPPSIVLPENFKTFGTLIQREPGKIRQIIDLSPRDASASVIPPITLNLFDTERGVYVTLRSRPIPLTVRGAQGEGLALLPKNVAAGDDLRALKMKRSHARGTIQNLALTIGLVGAPLALGFLGLVVGWRRRTRDEDVVGARRRGAASALRKRIAETRSLVDAGDDARTTAHALRIALAEFIGDLTDTPAARYEADLTEPLDGLVNDDLLARLVAITEQIDQVTFGGVSARLDELLNSMSKLAKEIEREL